MADENREGPEVRAALQEYIGEQARWRAHKASEYREDRRNVASAEALRILADYVSRLPDTDSRLSALAELRDALLPSGDVFMPGEDAAQMISRYGFDRQQSSWQPERASDFLDSLVRVCQQEANHFRLQSLQEAATTDAALEALEDLDRAEEKSEDV